MNIKNKKKSLMYKTNLILITSSIIILIILYLFQITYLNIYYEHYKTKEVTKIANSIIIHKKIDKYLVAKAIESNICIKKINDSKTYIYGENNKGCILNTNDKYITNIMENMKSSNKETIFYKVINPIYKSKTLLYGVRLNDGSYIYINGQLENLDSVSMIIKHQLIYILCIVVILSIIISYILSNIITKPIIDITNKANKLTSDNLEINYDSSDIKEINDLSKALNYAKNEIRKTDEYRKNIMANVGHDLKTPLTLIKGYAELIKDISYEDIEKRNKHLDIIISETDRLNNLVNDIITLSKTENSLKLNKERYDLIKQLDEIINSFEILSIKDKYKFIKNTPKEAYVYADKSKIYQVIYNLLSNAINYTGKDLKIYINIYNLDEYYKVEIIDTGKGIDNKNIKNIWNRYYRISNNHKRNIIGTGLGLSIVKQILDKHKFKYGVESEINKGANFYFYIKKDNNSHKFHK